MITSPATHGDDQVTGAGFGGGVETQGGGQGQDAHAVAADADKLPERGVDK